MVESWLKIVNKSGRKQDVLSAIQQILARNFVGLDIHPLSGKKGYYRCRIGKIRIVFFEKDSKLHIDNVGYRGDIYKDI